MSDQVTTQRYYYVQNKEKVREILALPNSELTCCDKLVLLHLLSYIGKRYFSWPAQATIAKNVGLSERSVRYSLKTLIDKGLIVKMKKGYKSEKFGIHETRSTSYDLSNLLISKEVPQKDDTGKELQSDTANNNNPSRKGGAD